VRVAIATAAVVVVATVIALVLAKGGGDEDSTREGVGSTSSATIVETLSSEEKVQETADLWARLFAAADDDAACRYETQPLCERITCERISGPIENCQPPSSALRKSFEDATVQDIAIKGDRAAARFLNGEAVELFHATRDGDVWWIAKFGGNAGRKFFK
jgi:hypothetical protein